MTIASRQPTTPDGSDWPAQGMWTIADRDALPDDGRHRHELVDGVLLVSPAPRPSHQGLVVQLSSRLLDAAPPDLRVYVAPLDVVLADDTVVQPDLLVAPATDFTDANLPAVPLLAVEVLSPGTRRVDERLKLHRYERAGVPTYWIVDPDTLELAVHELVDGRYTDRTTVRPGESWTTAKPFGLTLDPADLRY